MASRTHKTLVKKTYLAGAMVMLLAVICSTFANFADVSAEQISNEFTNRWGGSDYDSYLDVAQAKDGGYVAVGNSSSSDGDADGLGGIDAIISKYDADGKLQWEETWGGSTDEYFTSVIQMDNGDFVAAGYTNSTINGLQSFGNIDAVLVRYANDGELVGAINWGGSDGDEFLSVSNTADGGLLAAGISSSPNLDGLTVQNTDAILVKYDKDGAIEWQQNWGGIINDTFFSAVQTDDGGYVAAGLTGPILPIGLTTHGMMDAMLVKYDADGNMLWQKNWGGAALDYFHSVAEDTDGNIIAVGESASTDIAGLTNHVNDDEVSEGDAVIVKFNDTGNMLWQKNLGGSSRDLFNSVALTDDGDYLVAGYAESTDVSGLTSLGNKDAIIAKYDADGNMLWQKNWGGSAGDELFSITPSTMGGYAAVGYSDSVLPNLVDRGAEDAVIIKDNTFYNVKTTTTEGTVEADTESAVAGDQVKLSITPAPGHYVSTVEFYIAGTDTNITDEVKYDAKTSTFLMPASDVDVRVTFTTTNPNTLDQFGTYAIVLIGLFAVVLVGAKIKTFSRR